MKRITSFAAPQLWALVKSNLLLLAIGILLVFVASVESAHAQSRDRANPTRLASNEISGTIGDNLGDVYYYSFEAGPGEVTIRLNVETGRTGNYSWNQVQVELYNEDRQKIDSILGYVGRLPNGKENSAQKVERITFSRRQRVLLSIFIYEDNNSPGGKYQLRFDGAVHVSKDKPFGPEDLSRNRDVNSGGSTASSILRDMGARDCLPKQGTLVIKMKDGSVRKIDLSQAETVTIVP